MLGILVLAPVVIVLNRPGEARLETARVELASAGYPDAKINRAQGPTNLHRCEVGQVRNKGYAYGWTSGARRGVFCLRQDGRPNRIILD